MSTKKRIIRYSEAFKHQVLDEIASGVLTLEQARMKYGIKGGQTIQKWARKYGTLGVLPKIVRVEKPDEIDRIKQLQAENKQLKQALAETLLDQRIAESTLEVICEQRGLDVEEIKKKAGMLLQERLSRKVKK